MRFLFLSSLKSWNHEPVTADCRPRGGAEMCASSCPRWSLRESGPTAGLGAEKGLRLGSASGGSKAWLSSASGSGICDLGSGRQQPLVLWEKGKPD